MTTPRSDQMAESRPEDVSPEPPAPRGLLGGRSREELVLLCVYAITLFVSSSLLFLVQPMFGKMVLPLLGGAPHVWITSMLFFQAALLGGYAYAHWAVSRLQMRRQALLHVAIVLLPLLMLPISVPDGWVPPAEGNPILWLLLLLLVSLGLPFFVVSTSAPLLQRWFSKTTHPAAKDPYFLYGAGNLGSMLALLAYPLLMEPTLPLASQTRLWAFGYGLLALGTIACGIIMRRTPHRGTVADVAGNEALGDETHGYEALGDVALKEGADESKLTGVRRLRWVALAFVASSFMLAVTTHITTDIAAIPLLWVIPLALYLLSFILVFSPSPIPVRWPALVLPGVVIPLVLAMLSGVKRPQSVLIALPLIAFFVSALVCHGQIAADRPSPRHLTEFYLWIAVGGVLGGVFNALLAPVIFDGLVEYPLSIVLACLAAPPLAARRTTSQIDRFGLLVLPSAVILLTVLLTIGAERLWQQNGRIIGLGAALAICSIFVQRPLRFAIAIGAVMIAASINAGSETSVLYRQRTFFGVQRVLEDETGGFHRLMHGTTLHGIQNTAPELRREPLSYYHRESPIGHVLTELPAAKAPEIGLIGLGTGTLACYAQPGQRWVFYEIDPVMEQIARNPRLFTYLRDCPGEHQVVLGDARLSLRRVEDGRFGVLVVDAFNSDAIPVHLLTREAIQLYLSKLAPDGVVALHISNRYVDLEPVLADIAVDLDLTSRLRSDGQTLEQARQGKSSSVWVVLARRPVDLGPLAQDPRWRSLTGRVGFRVWTDDFSDLFSVFRWR